MKRISLLCLFIAGFAAVLSAQNPTAIYRISHAAVNEKPVNPLIYGNFIELGLGRQIEGLWAEKLYNASFEEVPPLKSNLWEWLGKSPADDLSREKWWHAGYETNDWYPSPVSDQVKFGYNRYWNFHHGLQAAVLENRQKTGRAFLAQDGIWINPGVRYFFRGYFSNNHTADPGTNPVKVTIGIYPEKRTDIPLTEQTITVSDGIFREFSVELNPGKYSGRATFAVSVEPGAIAALDGFSLLPMNSVKGWRVEAVEALKKIHVPMIRFPGGCFASFYDWREGVGPRLDRQPVISEYWGGIEENHAGTVEFVELCRLIGAEPFLCVNILTGTADRAAQWVEYCNGNPETPMGALRKQHGYPDPLQVKYWELDNETYRRFGWEGYARRCVEYSKAMKAADPEIKLVMVGYWKFNENLKDMLDIAGKYIDVITDRATQESNLMHDLEIINEYNHLNDTHITLSNTEWLAPLDWSKSSLDALNLQKSPNSMTLQEHEITWNYAMNTARQLLLFQRLGGDFEFASFNNLANTWGQNIIECPKDTVFISAAGRVFQLMSRSPLRWVLKTDTVKNLPGVLIQAGVSLKTKMVDPVIPAKAGTFTPDPNFPVIPAKAGTFTPDPNFPVIPAKAGTFTPGTNFPVIPAKAGTFTPDPNFPVIPAKAGTFTPDTKFLLVYILNYRSDSPEILLDLKDLPVSTQAAIIRTVNAAGPLSSNTFKNPGEINVSERNIRIKNPRKPAFKVLPWSVTEITLILLKP